MKSLAALFPEEDHRFHLTLRRGETAAFFAPAGGGALLAERRHWLDTAPGRHTALLPEGEGLRGTFASMLGFGAEATLADLGRRLEPDFLFLAPDAAGRHRLLGGVLCFPTGWSLVAQLGRPLEAIHGAVPELNATLASPIQQMLSRLKPENAFLRANWGLAATPELNLHPELARPRLTAPLDPECVWLRVEHQLLAGLDDRGGVLFGIRVECLRLKEAIADERVRQGLHRALATMSEPVAAYKGLAHVRGELLRITAGS